MPDVSEKVTIKRCNPMEVVKKDCVVLDHLKVKSDPKKEKWSLAHSDGGGGGKLTQKVRRRRSSLRWRRRRGSSLRWRRRRGSSLRWRRAVWGEIDGSGGGSH